MNDAYPAKASPAERARHRSLHWSGEPHECPPVRSNTCLPQWTCNHVPRQLITRSRDFWRSTGRPWRHAWIPVVRTHQARRSRAAHRAVPSRNWRLRPGVRIRFGRV